MGMGEWGEWGVWESIGESKFVANTRLVTLLI